jgi:C2 domain
MAGAMVSPHPLPRGESLLSVAQSDAPSLSTLGPSPSERFVMEVAAERGGKENAPGGGGNVDGGKGLPRVCVSAAELAEVEESVRTGKTGADGCDSDDDASVLTITRTITRLEDLPENKSEAIGTVLEEVKPRPVPLMVEYLGSNALSSRAVRAFCNELYDAPLELSVECQFLPKVDVFSNSDPYAEVWSRATPSARWELAGRTETLTNAHFPRFVTKFKLAARPDADMERGLMVKVLARGNFSKPVRLGEAVCNVWDVVSAAGHCRVMRLARSVDPRKDSWVILTGDVCRDRMHALAPRPVTLHVQFSASARPRSKTHYVVSRGLSKGRWTPVYRSEGHAHAEREFAPAGLTFADVFCGDGGRPARIEFYQRRAGVDAKLAGFVQFSLLHVERMEEGCAFQWWAGQDATPPGMVMLVKKEISRGEIKLWLSVTNE